MTLVLMAGMAGTAHAAAGDDARIVFREVLANATSDASLQIRCDPGEVALGGGTRSLGSDDVVVRASGPLSAAAGTLENGEEPTQWFITGYNPRNVQATFRSYAICSASSDGLIRFADITTAPSPDGANQGSATVMCPTGQRAVGGGVVPLGGGGTVEANGPVDETGDPANTVDLDIPRGWLVSMVSGGQAFARAYAVCSPTSTATVQVESLGLGQNNGAGVNVSAMCPTAERLISGGVINTAGYGVVVATTPATTGGNPATSDVTVGSGWFARVRNYGPAATFKAAAVCEAPTPAPTPTDPTAPTNPTGPTNPTAPSNDFSIGRLVRNTDRGTGRLPLVLPGPGEVILSARKLKPQAIVIPAAGEFLVKVKAAGKAKRKLRRKGKLKVAATVTFTPSGGVANTVATRAKLKRK